MLVVFLHHRVEVIMDAITLEVEGFNMLALGLHTLFLPMDIQVVFVSNLMLLLGKHQHVELPDKHAQL